MELESLSDQQEQRSEAEPPMEESPPPAPRGRPWVKGQWGNPAGRPPRRHHVAAVVAHGMIDRKTIPLTDRLIGLALAGDKTALRLCIERIVPRRREMPLDLQLPSMKSERISAPR
jgi:hypothetical protein